ncbi:MAG: O-antigen ligase family protein [Pseudomonadota bacterium]
MGIILFLLLLTAFSIGLSLVLTGQSLRRYAIEEPTFRILTLLFSTWLVAAVFWGPNFLVYRPAGLPDITIDRIAFAIILIFMVLGLFTGQIDLTKNTKIEFYMFVFVIVCLISMTKYGFTSAAPERFPSPWLIFILGYLFPFAAFLFAKNYLKYESDHLLVLHTIFFIGAYLAIISYFEFFNLRQFVFPRFINDPKLIIHLERARGPFLNSAVNGIALTFGFVSGIYLVQRKQGFTKLAYFFLLSLFLPAIFFTQTRSIYLSFLVALILLLAFYRTSFPKWQVFALPLGLAIIILLAISPRFLSGERRAGGVMQIAEARIRLQLIERSLDLFMKHPFFGVGLAQFLPVSSEEYRGRGTIAKAATDEQVQHNHLAGMLVEIGLIGLVIYVIIHISILKRLYTMSKMIPKTGIMDPNFLLVIFIFWCVYMVNNQFIEPGYFVFLNSVPLVFAGIADGIYSQSIA